MGLLSGTFGFKRFSISGELPLMPDDSLLDPLIRHAFGKAAKATSDGSEHGFITCEHLFDTQFDLSRCSVGDFMYWQFRMDKNTPPAELVRSYVRIEEQAALAASKRAFLTKAERKQARESARERAEREAKSGAFRQIRACSVLLDLAEQRILFGNTGNAASEAFSALFEVAFDLTLENVSAGELATRAAQQLGMLRALEDLKPAHVIQPPGDHIAAGIGSKLFRHDKDFLGLEFLTWLAMRCDREQGVFALPGRGKSELTVMLDKAAEFLCVYDVSGKMTLRCDLPHRAAECAAAVATGKQIRKASLVLVCGGEQYTLTLDGPSWAISSLAVPDEEAAGGKAGKGDRDQDPLAERQVRFEHMREAVTLLERLFSLFVKTRCGPDWVGELRQLKRWVADAQEQKPAAAKV